MKVPPILRTFRGQLLLIGGLCAGCFVFSIAVTFVRPQFEKYIGEKYAKTIDETPQPIVELIDAAERGPLPDELVERLSVENQSQVYDHAIQIRPVPSLEMRRNLIHAFPETFRNRCERTIVIGNESQREIAIIWLATDPDDEVIKKLKSLLDWARYRKLTSVESLIKEAITEL